MNKENLRLNPKSAKRICYIKDETKNLTKRLEVLSPEDKAYMLGAIATLEAVRGNGTDNPLNSKKKGA